MFGAQQSVLESVLLKRRVMGPSWISLHCPTRIDASKQARLCLPVCLFVPCLIFRGSILFETSAVRAGIEREALG